jgi:hypothetical protein
MIYEKIAGDDVSFKEMFEDFWENVTFSTTPSGQVDKEIIEAEK